jgi:hypothetical protein
MERVERVRDLVMVAVSARICLGGRWLDGRAAVQQPL